MIKRIILCLVLVTLVWQAFPQKKQSDKIKRKYRQENQRNENIPEVLVHGRVLNLERESLAGATVSVPGTRIGVNTNEDGEYFLKGLKTGRVSIVVSFVGYRTKIIDYVLQEGNNDVYFTLDRDNITLEAVTVTSQLREQQLPDIPQSVSVVGRKMIENNHITDMPRLSEFVPGLLIREQTPHRPNYVIRGLTSDEVSLSAQPRVSVYYNNVPTSRPSMSSAALYDMDRIEVLKGPQNTLFGRGAEAGAVHFLTRKPDSEVNGFLTIGGGDFKMKEVQGAVNIPVLKNKLFLRTAGIYSFRDGYVENTFGGNLNGKNTLGGRMSLRFLPFYNTKVDLVVNYQKDDLPGTAFMNKNFPNSNGITGIFNNKASLEQGKNLKNYRDVLGTSLEIKHFRNENNYFYSNTSYYLNGADSRWDGDGTAAPAIDMAENLQVKQFSQELRYNFSRKSKINGSLGANYWQEKADQTYWFGPNEQYMAYLILQMPQYLISPDGKTYPMPALPLNPSLGPLAGMPLPILHEEENRSSSDNQTLDLFADATWRLSPRISLTSGIRGIYEHFRMNNESVMTRGEPSTLGMLTQMYPNLFFKPIDKTEVSKKWKALIYRANLKYDLYENSSLFAGYARGRRPPVIQFNSQGESLVMQREILNSFEAGLKTSVKSRLWIDITGFFQFFKDFQTNAWVENNYLVKDAGKATVYGAEASIKGELLKNLGIFGNYAYIHARFDKSDSEGNAQEYAGNEFRLTPAHSFTIGLNGSLKLSPWMQLFAHPSWSWKSHIWFEDANTPELEQGAYGTLNATTGFLFPSSNLTFTFSGTNLLEERFIISAGNTGTMFGVPTFVPGPPRMLEARVAWKF
jgi:iron complex outermembrane receptor protein